MAPILTSLVLRGPPTTPYHIACVTVFASGRGDKQLTISLCGILQYDMALCEHSLTFWTLDTHLSLFSRGCASYLPSHGPEGPLTLCAVQDDDAHNEHRQEQEMGHSAFACARHRNRARDIVHRLDMLTPLSAATLHMDLMRSPPHANPASKHSATRRPGATDAVHSANLMVMGSTHNAQCNVSSRCNALGVAREHARLPDVAQSKVQHHHALHAHSAAAVRRRAELERVQIRPDGVGRDAVQLRALFEVFGGVDALRARYDLLRIKLHVS